LQTLPIKEGKIVVFIAIPVSMMSLSSPILRHIISAVMRAQTVYANSSILFQFIPEVQVFGSMRVPAYSDKDVETLCYTIYDRLLTEIDREMSRSFFRKGQLIRRSFYEPVFTLSRNHSTFKFSTAPHASIDVVDRHTLLHVGYTISSCGRWLLAACSDARGENYNLGTWLLMDESENKDKVIADKVWTFALEFARLAAVEWRVVICKLGTITVSEREGK
jgi:mediator of RNA polymerase II transcription subunit 13, fungi type